MSGKTWIVGDAEWHHDITHKQDNSGASLVKFHQTDSGLLAS